MRPTDAQLRLPDWLLLNRNFVLLWAAYGISAFGDHLSEMALLKEAGGLERDDVTRVQALMTFCFFLPFVLCGPLAGWWADRFSRKWTMIVADVVRAAIVISLSITVPMLLGWGLGDFAIALPLLLTGLFAALFSPCRQAMTPTLIRDDQLVRANAMISALGTIGAILSAVVGGILVDWAVAGHFGLYWNYRLDAATYIASAVLILGISMSRTRATEHRLAAGVWTPLRAGFRYVRQHKRVLQMIILGVVFWAAAGIVISVVPAIVRDVFGGKFSDAGMYRGLIAAGLAIGAAILTIVGPTMPLPLAVLIAIGGGAFWVAVLDVAVIFKLGRLLTGLSLLMMGVHGAGILVNVMVVIQRFVPDSRRGRVFGVSDMATMAAIAAATGLLGLPRIPHLDAYIPWLLALTALGLAIATWRAWREYRRGDPLGPVAWIVWRVIRFHAAFMGGVKRLGPCTVPRSGPVIVAANHTAGIDPLAMLTTCTHRVISFVVDHKYYNKPLLRWFMQLNHCVPVNRERPGKSFMSGSLRLLKEGGCLGIFPQGTFVGPGEEEPDAKYGIGVLALRTGAAVVPCHISGTIYDYNPVISLFRRHRARVRYGQPMDLSAFAGRERDREAAREAAELIMQRIRELENDA